MNTDQFPRTPFWKPALGGVIAGAAFFFIPFLLPLLGIMLLMGLVFRLVSGGPRWPMRHAMAWQQMSEEQRAAMRERFRQHRCGPWGKPPANDPSIPNNA